MKKESEQPISNVADLLLHAYTIEREASDRYLLLGDQMSAHNNPAIADLFYRLATIEGRHADEIRARMQGMTIPERKPWTFQWLTPESPEAADITDAHYLMKPYHALKLALMGEEQAHRFFSAVAEHSRDPELRRLAEEFAGEELNHIEMVKKLLAEHTEPGADWDYDSDPPAVVD